MKMLNQFLLSVMLMLTAHSASAAIVYDGGSPDLANGYYADTDYFYTATATKNTLSNSTTFNSMTWWGADDADTNAAGNFTLSIFDDSGSVPGTLITSTLIANLSDVMTGNLISATWGEHMYTGDFSAITLAAGTYFFQLSNNDVDPSGTWFWESTANGLSGGVSLGSSYVVTNSNLAFNLSNNSAAAVPEPESWATLLCGIALMGGIIRRKRQS